MAEFEKNNAVFLTQASAWLCELQEGIPQEDAQAGLDRLFAYEKSVEPPLFFHLCKRLALEESAALLLLCALAAEYSVLTLSFGEARRVLAPVLPADCSAVCLPDGAGLFSLLWQPWCGASACQRPLTLRREIAVFLMRGYFEALAFHPPGVFCSCVHTTEYEVICAAMKRGESLVLSGPSGAGKRVLAARCCELWGGGITCGAEGDALSGMPSESALLAAAVTGRPLCVPHAERCGSAFFEYLRRFPELTVLLLSEDERIRPDGFTRVAVSEPLPPEEAEEAARFLGVDLPRGLRLSIGELCRFAHAGESPSPRGLLLAHWGGRTSNGLAALCEEDGGAKLENISGTAARGRLALFSAMVRSRLHLLDELGFSALHPGGRSTLCLFHGASGTGKTYAAHTVARGLAMPLLRVDISNVLDKYLGETEKHLDEVFTLAERLGCLLLFDEADALFARRTEVRSSHDRYANLSTSYLLQRLESFDGAAILCTNLLESFDGAFLRRIPFVIRFSMPDEGERRLLWARAFPAAVSLSGDIDTAVLARRELTPAQIANSALLATALALEGDGCVTAHHIEEAIRIEMEKGA